MSGNNGNRQNGNRQSENSREGDGRTVVVVFAPPPATEHLAWALVRRRTAMALLCNPEQQPEAARLRDAIRGAGGVCELIAGGYKALQARKRDGRSLAVIDMRPKPAGDSDPTLPDRLRLFLATLRQ